jgi:hypothetical protein
LADAVTATSTAQLGIGASVFHLLALGEMVNAHTTELYLVVFGIGCAIAAALILVLDICVFTIRGWSFLRLEHAFIRTAVVAVLLPTAAGIVGMLGLALEVVQASRAACVAVGIAWPSLLTVLMGVPEHGPDDDEEPEPGEEPVE